MGMNLARKIKLVIVSDQIKSDYDFILKETYKQNLALNVAYSHLHFEHIAVNKLKSNNENYIRKKKELLVSLEKKYAEYQQCQEEEKKNKLLEAYEKAKKKFYDFEKTMSKEAREQYGQAVGFTQQTRVRNVINEEFDLASDTKDCITSKVVQDYRNDIKFGLLQGKRSLRNYRSTHPLLVRGRALQFYAENENYYIKWIKGIIFKVALPIRKGLDIELKSVLENILLGKYKVCDSSMDSKGKLILNLSLSMPGKETIDFIPGRIVGVDLGMAVPAYVSLNDPAYIKMSIGTYEEFARVRTQMQNRKRQLQVKSRAVTGGKGRQKKLKTLEKLKDKESNFAKTYNHYISSRVVKFALKYRAGQINLEKITSGGLDHSVLRKWSYYQLQQMIEYKASREGIVIRYIDPYRTSQTCSACGHYEEGQRINQKTFLCKKCRSECNADYNASQNIANSIDYV